MIDSKKITSEVTFTPEEPSGSVTVEFTFDARYIKEDTDIVVFESLYSEDKGNVAGSQPEFSFHWHGTSDKIFLFEAPIDMLSYISMHKKNWQEHSYAASCSVSDRVLFQCLKDNPNVKKVFLCFDNDEAGQTANKRISDKLNSMNIQNEILVPTHKDWNEEILKNERTDEICHQVL